MGMDDRLICSNNVLLIIITWTQKPLSQVMLQQKGHLSAVTPDLQPQILVSQLIFLLSSGNMKTGCIEIPTLVKDGGVTGGLGFNVRVAPP